MSYTSYVNFGHLYCVFVMILRPLRTTLTDTLFPYTTRVRSGGDFRAVSNTPVRIGKPYTVRGATYVPAAAPAYDAIGYASWYGSESGNQTANGEKFRPAWITAAHRTLPLPTYVEVTALDTGRRIVVRVNDRGPFAGGDRILDLSKGDRKSTRLISSH